jgi:hypothetical protein
VTDETWFEFQPTTYADKKQLASRAGIRELVAKAAVVKGTKKKCPYDDEDFADEVNLYVREEKELVVITNFNFAEKTKDVVELYAYVPAPTAPEGKQGGGGDQGSDPFKLQDQFLTMTARNYITSDEELITLLRKINAGIDELGIASSQIIQNMQKESVGSLSVTHSEDEGCGGHGSKSSSITSAPMESVERTQLPKEKPSFKTTPFSRLRSIGKVVRAELLRHVSINAGSSSVPKQARLLFEISQQLIILNGARKLASARLAANTARNTPVKLEVKNIKMSEADVQLLLHRGLNALAEAHGLTVHDARSGPFLTLHGSKLCSLGQDSKNKACLGHTDLFVCKNSTIRGLIEIKVHFDVSSHLSQMLASLLGLAAGVNDKLESGEASWSSKKVGADGAAHMYGLLFNGFQLIAARTTGHDKFDLSRSINHDMVETLWELFRKMAGQEPLALMTSDVDASVEDSPSDHDVPDFDPDPEDEGKQDTCGSNKTPFPSHSSPHPSSSPEDTQNEDATDENADAGCSSNLDDLSSLSEIDLLFHDLEQNKDTFWCSLLGRNASSIPTNYRQPFQQQRVN